MGGLHCVSVAGFDRSQSKFTFKFSAAFSNHTNQKKKGAENECQRERRTAGTTWYMYIYWRNRGPGPRKCILVYRGPSVLHPMPDTPSPFPVPPFPRYQFSRIQNALGPYLDTVQCTRDSPHVWQTNINIVAETETQSIASLVATL